MGSVGIGNLNPQAKLDIQGTSTTNSYSAQADQADLRILSANNRPYDGAILELGGAWGATGYIKTEALNGTAGAMTLGVRQSTSNPAMNPLMTLDMSGNVGINNTNPAATLDVNGSVKLEGAGTPGAGKVLTSDAAGNATWQMSGVKSNGPVYQSSQAVISDHGCVNFNHNLGYIPICQWTSSNENQVVSIRSIDSNNIKLCGWSPAMGQSTNVSVYCY